ncbi:MAG: type II toxin-antitoxin system PemK/MazF family toxin [Mycobacterium sp.]
MILQGEIRGFDLGGYHLTVVVISSDRFNRHAAPIVAPIRREGFTDHPPMMIALHEADSYKGVVDISDLGSAPEGSLSEHPLATVIGDTMDRIRQAVKDIVDD